MYCRSVYLIWSESFVRSFVCWLVGWLVTGAAPRLAGCIACLADDPHRVKWVRAGMDDPEPWQKGNVLQVQPNPTERAGLTGGSHPAAAQ